MLSLATADSGTAANSPPTTRTTTRRRKPLTERHPFSFKAASGPAPSSGRRPLALADCHNVTPFGRSRHVAKSHDRHPAVTSKERNPAGSFPSRRRRRSRAFGLAAPDPFFRRLKRVLSFDRGADQASPFGPGAVVVPDVGIAEQVLEDEPGVGGALPD